MRILFKSLIALSFVLYFGTTSALSNPGLDIATEKANAKAQVNLASAQEKVDARGQSGSHANDPNFNDFFDMSDNPLSAPDEPEVTGVELAQTKANEHAADGLAKAEENSAEQGQSNEHRIYHATADEPTPLPPPVAMPASGDDSVLENPDWGGTRPLPTLPVNPIHFTPPSDVHFVVPDVEKETSPENRGKPEVTGVDLAQEKANEHATDGLAKAVNHPTNPEGDESQDWSDGRMPLRITGPFAPVTDHPVLPLPSSLEPGDPDVQDPPIETMDVPFDRNFIEQSFERNVLRRALVLMVDSYLTNGTKKESRMVAEVNQMLDFLQASSEDPANNSEVSLTVQQNADGSQIDILTVTNADGTVATLMIVYSKSENIPVNIKYNQRLPRKA